MAEEDDPFDAAFKSVNGPATVARRLKPICHAGAASGFHHRFFRVPLLACTPKS